MFCSQIFRASSVFDSRRVWTSPSACRRSSALKQDISFASINSSSFSLCFGFFFECWIFFFNISQITCFLAHWLCLSCPLHRHKNISCSGFCRTWELKNIITLKFSCIEIRPFIVVCFYRTWKFTVFLGVQLCYLHSHLIPSTDQVA